MSKSFLRALRCSVAVFALGLAGSAAGQGPMLAATGAVPTNDGLAGALDALEQSTAERDRVNAEIEGLVTQRDAAQRRLHERVRALYRMRRAGVLPLAGGFQALLRHQSRVDRLERMVSRDVRGLATLRHRVSALRAETSTLAERVEQSEQRVSALREAEQAQMNELEVLSGMIEDPGAWSGASAPGFGLRLVDPPSHIGLAAHRGSLPVPVAGSARLADAEREGGAGLELAATPGVTVRSVLGGRVAYAAPHPAYGRLVILDHGDGHYTVYGGLGALGVTVGQELPTDAVLGTVGAQPVFFQVRRGTRPLPAREWLGL